MDETDRSAYVMAALALSGYRVDAETARRVVAEFERFHAVGQDALSFPLGAFDEPLPVYRA